MKDVKELKKSLSKLKSFRRELPILIDCSELYGDGFYTNEDLVITEELIRETEQEIKDIKIPE